MRECGILLPISSLPSPYGIGSFSREAYEFVDFLKKAGQSVWQILSMGPTGYGDSPYQSFSTFAGNPYFIDLEALIRDGYLERWECESSDFGGNEERVDYGKLYQQRYPLLRKAFERFRNRKEWEFDGFVHDNAFWLEDYSLFMALRMRHDGAVWNTWEEDLRCRHQDALERARAELSYEMEFYRFQQYMFYKQWGALHRYAHENGIKIVGDLPIYVAFDSADTWAGPELFQFTPEHLPSAVAGCPPDVFSETGQLWGNPVYNWDYHRQSGYEWWIRRIEHNLKLYDVLRIDHFRGFDEYYAVPYGKETAQNGSWQKGPGMELFRAVRERLGEMEIIAEDLGYLTDSVKQLLKESGFPGMKILQFAFDSRDFMDYLPHSYTENCVVYTGTHDNDTTKGWFLNTRKYCRDFAKEYMHKQELDVDTLSWDFIALAMGSVAKLCVIPVQDYLCLGSEARVNAPATLGGNWSWRMKKGATDDALAEKIRDLAALYGRLPQ